MTNGNDAAHPTLEQNGNERWNTEYGLTKREHFAAIAMQGILCQLRSDIQTAKLQAEYYAKSYPDKTMFEAVAIESTLMADALISQLNQ